MSVIYKYEIAVADRVELVLPQYATFLSAQVQRPGAICLWYLIEDPDAPKETRTLHIYGTGNPFDVPRGCLFHQATVQDPPFVWHLFERLGF